VDPDRARVGVKQREPGKLVGLDDPSLTVPARQRARVVPPSQGIEADPPPAGELERLVDATVRVDEQPEAHALLVHQPARLVVGADGDATCRGTGGLHFVEALRQAPQVVPAR